MRQNFIVQLIQLLKHWLCDVQLGVIVEKNWALSVDQCWLPVLEFLVHLINLLSILFKRNGVARIHKVVADQTGNRPPNTDHDLFGGCKFGLGSASELLFGPTTELVVAGCHTKSTFHHTS